MVPGVSFDLSDLGCPILLHLHTRLTLLESSVYEAQKDRDRFTLVIDRMNDNLGQLATAIAELRVEVRNLQQAK